MTVASDLRQAAIDVFDALTGVPIEVTYVGISSTPYVAGGDLTKNEDVHPGLRIIREERNELAMAIAGEVGNVNEKYLFITSELSIKAKKGDNIIKANGDILLVDEVDNDAVDAVTTVYLESA